MADNYSVRILEGVVALYREPNTWTQNASARDRSGKVVYYQDQHACRWCLHAAVLRQATIVADAESKEEVAYQRARAFLISLIKYDMVLWNDIPGRTQAEVLEVSKKALAAARMAA